MDFRFQVSSSPVALALVSVVILSLVLENEALKLEKYLDDDSSIVAPALKASLLNRQGKLFQIYTVSLMKSRTKELVCRLAMDLAGLSVYKISY